LPRSAFSTTLSCLERTYKAYQRDAAASGSQPSWLQGPTPPTFGAGKTFSNAPTLALSVSTALRDYLVDCCAISDLSQNFIRACCASTCAIPEIFPEKLKSNVYGSRTVRRRFRFLTWTEARSVMCQEFHRYRPAEMLVFFEVRCFMSSKSICKPRIGVVDGTTPKA